MVEVEVEYNYEAQEPDELNIRKGDIIKDVRKKSDGWCEGILNGKRGVFPDNFVKFLDKDVVIRTKKETDRKCRVVFSYKQDHVDELSLNVGDVISVIGEDEEGWWRGILNGKEGVFPSNFVEEIRELPPPPRPTNRNELLKLTEEAPALPAKPVKEFCKVHFGYKAQKDDELTLKEGDIVTIISKDAEDQGWWRGELNGKIGVFPDNFVTLLLNNVQDKNPSPKHEAKPPANTNSAIKPSSVASQRKSLEIKKTDASKSTPPLPGKKPSVSLKKSPSGSSAGGLFSKLKDKIADAVDGVSSSKVKEAKEVKESEKNDIVAVPDTSAFDQVDRRPLLGDVRASRARPPGRRLPSSVQHKEDGDDSLPTIPNGNTADHSAKSEDSIKSEASFSSENLDNSSSSELDANESKPRLREWEKHRAPWLEEMKLNQAKRTSVSPVPDPKHKISPESDQGSKSSQNSPSEKEVNIVDMSKSMSDIKMSPGDVKAVGKTDKAPPLRSSKPLAPSTVKPTPISSPPSLKDLQPPKISKPAAPQPILTPKPKQALPEAVAAPPHATGGYLGYSSSFSHSSAASKDAQVTPKQFQEVLDRLARVEMKCELQEKQIEDLKNKLQVETELRRLLQEKVTQNSVQV